MYRWQHQWCFQSKGLMWDTPLAKWVGGGEGLDTQDGKETLGIVALLKMARRPTKHLIKDGHRDTLRRTEAIGSCGVEGSGEERRNSNRNYEEQQDGRWWIGSLEMQGREA